MEWFDAWSYRPPRDGSWIIAVNSDFSGIEFLRWDGSEWTDSEGGGGLFEDENFGLQHSVWTPAPKWMRIFSDIANRNSAFEKWRVARPR